MQYTELEILKSLRKSIYGVIELEDVFEHEYYIYIVLEYMEGRDLYEYSNNIDL